MYASMYYTMLLLYSQITQCHHNIIALFDGGSYWNLHLFRFGLILNLSLGVLSIAVQMVHGCVLSHQAQVSLRQFSVDLVHSLWVISYLFQILTYPGT